MKTRLFRANTLAVLVFFVAGCIHLLASPVAFAAPDRQGKSTDTQDNEKAAAEKEPSYRNKSLSQLIENLSHKSRGRRLYAIRAVTALKEQASPAVPKLIEIIRSNSDLYCCRYAVTALGAIGHKDEKAIGVLLESLKHDDLFVRKRAKSSLVALSPMPDSVLPTFVGLLADEDARMQYTAAKLLYHAEKLPPELLQKVESALGKSSGGTRMYLALCLGAHRRIPTAAIPGLIDALKLQDSDGRMMGRRLVGTKIDHRETRRRAAAAMRLIGPDAKDAVPDLIEALKYRNVVVHESFIFGTRRTEDRGAVVRKPVAFALIRIGPAAVPALREAAKDADAEFQKSVKRILRSIEFLR